MTIDFERDSVAGKPQSTRRTEVVRVEQGDSTPRGDDLAVEEPLEIRVGYEFLGEPAERSVSVTMRTPGADRELAAGFLYGESMLSGPGDVEGFDSGADEQRAAKASNVVRIRLASHVEVDMASLQRNFYTTSSCGVCGKASLQALRVDECTTLDDIEMALQPATVAGLPPKLRDAQPLFETTGGIHAAGLFDERGQLIELREDVGRHNAMDKLVGSRLLADDLPVGPNVVVLSGRASFELLQKALRARVPMVVAVGAPSSLAVDLAERFGITLVGFARGERFNIYTHPRRIEL